MESTAGYSFWREEVVADTNGGTTLVNRVHWFYLHNPTPRLVLFNGYCITEGHYIKRPAGEYSIWVPSAEDNHQHVTTHGASTGRLCSILN